MKPEVAYRRIESFGKRFGEAHLIFAYHAAFPLALTPDLLYKLWANFQRDIHGRELGIPWVAVADLLLSSLCDEVGHELYEMDAAMRNLLLSRLKEDINFGQQRINELSDFLLAYVQQQLNSVDPDVRDFAQVQRWTALAYVRPSEAASELRLALEQVYQQDKSEQVRLTSLVETFAESLAEFEPLLVYAREMKKTVGLKASKPATILPNIQKVEAKAEDRLRDNKLVILKLGDGDFETGFTVTLQIGTENGKRLAEIQCSLPAEPNLFINYQHWVSIYRSGGYTNSNDDSRIRISLHSKLEAKYSQITNFSLAEFIKQCYQSGENFKITLNEWLNSEQFRICKEACIRKINPSDNVRFVIQTENGILQRLPWHLWNFFDDYRKAEIALSSLEFDRVDKNVSVAPRTKVRILAILGERTGIDIEKDQAFLQNLPDAECVFLVEPNRRELDNYLWDERGWDILFFAEHSSSHFNAETGKIYLNKNDSLTMGELRYALRRAIESGLQIAIFNSWDGLGLANQLASLGIPQIIVMREPVPDIVAQEFFKNFLTAFVSSQSFYLAVREAREKLQKLENHFPCASWLPVIFQNPAEISPTWQDLLIKR